MSRTTRCLESDEKIDGINGASFSIDQASPIFFRQILHSGNSGGFLFASSLLRSWVASVLETRCSGHDRDFLAGRNSLFGVRYVAWSPRNNRNSMAIGVVQHHLTIDDNCLVGFDGDRIPSASMNVLNGL